MPGTGLREKVYCDRGKSEKNKGKKFKFIELIIVELFELIIFSRRIYSVVP